jgi:phosphatidylserine/phosphatidylglycerophosphate/cardiolipin synthase-like enzyme
MATLQELEDVFFPPGLSLGDPHSADTVVTPHVDGQVYFGAVADVLDSLRGPGDRVYITSWALDTTMTLRPGAGQPTLLKTLADLAGFGVDVRMIVAVPRHSLGQQGAPFWTKEFWINPLLSQGIGDTARLNIASVHALRAEPRNGTSVLAGRVLVDWGGGFDSRHEKCTIVFRAETGDLQAFVGGMDYMPDRYADEYHLSAPTNAWWHDAGVQLAGGAAAAVLDNFRTRWDETATLPPQRYWFDGNALQFNPTIEATAPPPAPPQAPPPATVPAGSYNDASVRIWRSYGPARAVMPLRSAENRTLPWHTLPSTGVREVRDGISQAIKWATKYIYVEDQSINPGLGERLYAPHTILFPLLSDACALGVKVIFVTQGTMGPDQKFPFTANLDFSAEVNDLILGPLTGAERANFALFYVRDIKVHAKLVLVDDKFVSVGSANMWDRSQVGLESEVNAAIVHPGDSASLVADWRVRLWRGHFRVPASPAVDARLRDTAIGLGYFRSTWGTGSLTEFPNNALVEVTP